MADDRKTKELPGEVWCGESGGEPLKTTIVNGVITVWRPIVGSDEWCVCSGWREVYGLRMALLKANGLEQT